MMPMHRACLLAVLLLRGVAAAGEQLPEFPSDQASDRWLKENSAAYKRMADDADRRGGYDIRPTTNYPGGVAYFEHGRGFIGLNDVLKGAHRVSVLIFEMTNLFQEERHQEVAQRVRTGELNDPIEFSLLREMIENDGLRLHHDVLRDLARRLETVPPAMITWISGNTKTYDEYRPPFAYDYLKAQRRSGHTAHYIRLFEKHRKEYLDSVRQKAVAAK